jgi:hypothetical protein
MLAVAVRGEVKLLCVETLTSLLTLCMSLQATIKEQHRLAVPTAVQSERFHEAPSEITCRKEA